MSVITLNRLNDELIQTARLFGETEQIIQTALQSYLHTRCYDQMAKAQQHIEEYEQKYQSDYADFNHQIQTDEVFWQQIQQQNPLWEEDAMEWQYWIEEYETWQQHLQAISKIS